VSVQNVLKDNSSNLFQMRNFLCAWMYVQENTINAHIDCDKKHFTKKPLPSLPPQSVIANDASCHSRGREGSKKSWRVDIMQEQLKTCPISCTMIYGDEINQIKDAWYTIWRRLLKDLMDTVNSGKWKHGVYRTVNLSKKMGIQYFNYLCTTVNWTHLNLCGLIWSIT
jgi:hypothetical protein